MAVGKPSPDRGGRYRNLNDHKSRSAAASWEDAEAEELWRLISEVTAHGDALMFGVTRDGGACVLTVMSGDDRYKVYATGADEVAELIRHIRTLAKD